MKFGFIFFYILSALSCMGQESSRSLKVRIGNEFILTSIHPYAHPGRINLNCTYYWYSGQSVKSNRGGYHGQLLHGAFKRFDRENNLREFGKFKKGRKLGRWITWDGNGNLMVIAHWRRGRLHGKWVDFQGTSIAKTQKIYKRGALKKEIILSENGEKKEKNRFRWPRLRKRNTDSINEGAL